MDVKYAPELVESTIMEEMRMKEAQGDATLTNLYQSRAEPLYEFHEEERIEMFDKLHIEFFSSLGFDKMVRDILAEFPSLNRIGRALVVREETEEEADLMGEEGKHKLVLIRLQPDSFLHKARLSKILRHELMHVSDILDEAFEYRIERFAPSHAEEIVARDKYRLLWDINIDARLARRGAAAPGAKKARFVEFERLYQKIPEQHRKRVFEAIWSAEKMTHGELLTLAREPKKLLEKAGVAIEKAVLLPGMPCPLCKFPTYDWSEEIAALERGVIEAIKQDFPAWEPGHGVCGRCIEVYKTMVKGW